MAKWEKVLQEIRTGASWLQWRVRGVQALAPMWCLRMICIMASDVQNQRQKATTSAMVLQFAPGFTEALCTTVYT